MSANDYRFRDDEHGTAAMHEHIRGLVVGGGTFILDCPEEIPALWGEGQHIAWAQGESLILAGPPGVGKTTLVGQLVRGLLVGGEVLGMPVTPATGRVLYLAMDRPRQIRRALARTLRRLPREVLDRLVVWPGPPIADVAKLPETLKAYALAVGASVMIVDSLKDAAVGLSDDDVGAGYNRARQLCIAAGVDLVELHHTVKNGKNGGLPNTLADLYGSTWLAAGAGSVLMLWGDAGDSIVELRHLKTPADPVGPMKVLHDHDAGESSVYHAADLVALAARPGGVTAKQAASAIFDKDKPTRNEVEKARRRLDKLRKDGVLTETPGDDSAQRAAVWTTLTTLTRTLTALPGREPLTTPSQPSRSDEDPQVTTLTDTLTGLTDHDPHVSHPPYRGGERGPVSTCDTCGQPVGEMRATYGKTKCADCDRAAAR